MLDPAGPQLPQGMKNVNFDMINVKCKSEIIEQVSLKDSVQVQETSTSGTSNNDAANEKEVDLMNFDDDCLNFDFNNNHVNNTQQVSVVDQLLCDINFGRDPLTTKDELKDDNVLDNKMTQNEQTTMLSKQETSNKEIPSKDNDKTRTQNRATDAFTQTSPISLPSYADPADGVQLTATARTCAMHETQTSVNGLSRVKPANGTQVAPHLHTMKDTQSDIIVPIMGMTYQKPIGKPKRRKIYSFVELLIYQFSPITKELHNDVKGKFSHYVEDYDLLKDNSQAANNQLRRPGVLRGTFYQQRNEWNGQSFDAREHSMSCRNDRAITSPVRKHFESPSELSFLKECVIAQNRWTALLHERELRTSCVREVKDCKGTKWIDAHMNFTNKHTEGCLAFQMANFKSQE